MSFQEWSLFFKNRPLRGIVKKLPALRDRKFKCQKCQIASLIKVSILNATNRHAVCTLVGGHVGIAAKEVQVLRIGATNRTTPIGAAGTDIEGKITVVAEARHGQFKWRGKSTY